MNRKTVIVIVAVVGVAAVIGVACAKKSGPQELPATSEPGERGERNVPGALHGSVRTGDGQPVVGALVQATSVEDPVRPVPEIAVVTGGDGAFEWPLEPGRYRLSVNSPSGSGAGEVEVRVGVANDFDIVVVP